MTNTRADRWLPALLLLFVGSGAAALIYEIVWLQLLQLVIGSSAVSVGVLLGTFMGGMCLGSLLFSRCVTNRRHPLRVYAALELGIGACGALLLVVMPVVGRVYTTWGGGNPGGFVLRGLVAAVCLLPPTLAMGATLPAVARWTRATRTGMSWLGFFYAGNIAGAVGGSLLAGFYLLRMFDMRTATYVGVAINLVVAAVAFALASVAPASPDPTGMDDEHGEPQPGAALVYVAIACSGACALAAEVVWTRLLALLFGATVYTFSIILAVFLVGLGLGSSVGSVLARSVQRPSLAFGWCQVLAMAAIAWGARTITASLPFWPVSPTLVPNVRIMFEFDLVRTMWAILPAAMLWGASFPLALASLVARGQEPGRLVGRVYAANTVGAVVGALGASLVLVAWVGSAHTQQVMIAVAAAAALLGFAAAFQASARGAALVGAAAAASACVLVPGVPPVPGMLVAYGRYMATVLGQAGQVVYVGEGLNSSVAVTRLPSGKLGYHNAGKIQASSEPEDMRLQRMLGHLTTIVPAAPRSVLVIGCGAGVTAGAVSISPKVEHVTIAEIEPLVPRVVSTYFGVENYHVVDNPKVQVVIDDARHYLLTSGQMFDGITSDPLDPWVKGAATLYTREFFEAAKAHLNPGGVITLFVQLYESTPEAVKSEIASFFAAFPDGIIVGNTFRGEGYDVVLLGQVGPTRIDLDRADAELRSPAFGQVAESLGEIHIGSAVDLFGNYSGRASDLTAYLKVAAINHDLDLRLQYLAGLGLERYESDPIYGDILQYKRFPEGVFTGSDALMAALRARIERRR
ncbi:MAG: fused MFS/spermidine synthase [Acidobacteriota bacterium]